MQSTPPANSPGHEKTNLSDLHFADPDFGHPGKIDILLGIDIYADVLLQCWRNEPPGSPTAFETKFGWVLAGRASTSTSPHPPPVPFTTSLLLPLMTSFAGFGVSKKTQGMTTTFPLKNAPTCGTSVRHTPIRALEGSSFPSTNQQAIPFEVSRSQAI